MAIAAGEVHSLALKSNGSIVGWGDTSPLPAGNDFVAIAAGEGYSLVIREPGPGELMLIKPNGGESVCRGELSDETAGRLLSALAEERTEKES